MYKCSNCGEIMSQPLDRCSKCRVLLSGVKCEACGYTGGKSEFVNNNHRCPKCNSNVYISSSAHSSTPKSDPKISVCEKCGKITEPWDVTCPHCGYPQWNLITGAGVVSIICLGIAIFTSNFIRWSVGAIGVGLLCFTIYAIIVVALKHKPTIAMTPAKPKFAMNMSLTKKSMIAGALVGFIMGFSSNIIDFGKRGDFLTPLVTGATGAVTIALIFGAFGKWVDVWRKEGFRQVLFRTLFIVCGLLFGVFKNIYLTPNLSISDHLGDALGFASVGLLFGWAIDSLRAKGDRAKKEESKTNQNIPTLGIRFDIDKVGGGYYGLTCWQVFWRTVEPISISDSSLFQGDSDATLNGVERVFIISVQTLDRSKLDSVKEALSSTQSFVNVAATPMFVSDTNVGGESLVEAGNIDSDGNLVGKAGASRGALADVIRERRPVQDDSKSAIAIPRTIPASSRSANLPEISSLDDLDKLLKERFIPKSTYEYAGMWITPEELCDIVERYESQISLQWREGGSGLFISLFWKNPRRKDRLEFGGFETFPTASEAIRALTGDYKEYTPEYRIEGSPVRQYVDLLPKLANIQGRFKRNFQGSMNGGILSDYEDEKEYGVSPRDLWTHLCRHAEEVGMPMSQV